MQRRLVAFAIFFCGLIIFAPTLRGQQFFLLDTARIVYPTRFDFRNVIELNTCTWAEELEGPIQFNPAPIEFRAPDATLTGRSGLDMPIALLFDIGTRAENPNNRIEEDVVVYNSFVPFITPRTGPRFAPETSPRGISTDYRHNSFFIGSHISRIEETINRVTSLGELPPDMRPKGQMTFREGSFYYPSVNNELIQLKIAEPNYWIRSLGSLPDTLHYGGIFSIPHSCDSTRTFVLHHDPARGSTMYKLDIPSLELTEHCTMPFKPMAAAFEGENTLPPCNWFLDLDTRNDTTLVRYDTICTEAIAILDDNFELAPNLEVDSLIVRIINPLDGAIESLTLSDTDPVVIVSGNDSQRLTLASTGFTKGSEMLSLLANLNYENRAPVPTIGWRYLEVVLYHPFHGELTARIALYLSSGNNEESRYEEQSCEGTSIEVVGLSYRRDTTFQLQLANQFGCDSLVEVQLSFADTFAQQFRYQLCPGEDIMIVDQVIGVDTNFTLNLQSITGCDSTLYYEVIIEEALGSTVEASICAGETYPFAGAVYSTAGTYVDTLQGSNGCDSLHFLQLTVNPLPTPNIETIGNLCQDAAVELIAATGYTGYQWDNGSTASSIIATDAGTYGLAVTDSNGCTGTTSMELSNTPPVIIYEILQPNCLGETGTLLIEEINEGMPPYSIAGQLVEAGQLIPGFAEGIHEVIVTSSDQCETSIRFTVFPGEDLEVELLPSVDVEIGQPIQMPISTSSAVTNVLWSPANGLSCTDCLIPTVNPLVTTIYEVVITDDQGCQWVGTIEVKVPEVTLYVPNAFSPNLDNINEVFTAYPTELVESVSIYDRWGAQVFLSEEGTIGWDGRIRGQLAAEGVYIYVIEWLDAEGTPRVAYGEVTLVR